MYSKTEVRGGGEDGGDGGDLELDEEAAI